jgi:hypothetical protein
MVSVFPDIVATDVSLLVNSTVRDEVEVALRSKGASSNILEGRTPKVIVWKALLTTKVRGIAVAES